MTDPTPETPTDADAPVAVKSPRRGPGPLLIGALALVVVVAGVTAVAATRYRASQNQPPRLTGIPASVSTSLADLMALSPVPGAPAPDFTLTDQTGRRVTLSSLRGRVVVMEFMDTHCTDICPIVSQEFVDAYHDLGTTAANVAFVAVNVNPYHARVADVAAFSRNHQLDTIPSWHFVTGTTSALSAVWKNYGIEVITRGPQADVVHSSEIFFIDPSGHERYLANPVVNHTAAGTAFLPYAQITAWGHGIALTAQSLAG